MNNWDDLRFFIAVARQGSLSAAAKSLGVNQSTVFRKLKSLEAYLGTQIFDPRRHGKYEFTAAGESLISHAIQIEQATFNIDREVLGRDTQLSGTIRVTTAEDVAVALLPQHLLAFQQAYPSISVELITANRYFSLARGEADVAIRPSPSTIEDRVIPRKIHSTYFSLFAHPDYLKRAGIPQNKKDLDNHQIISWKGDLTEDGFSDSLNDIETQSATYGSNSLMAQYAMSQIGMGIALLPMFLGRSGNQLAHVLPEFRIDSGFIWILHHHDLRHTARVRAFVDFMYESLRQDSLLKI